MVETRATGNTEETNRVINALDDIDASERHQLYDDLLNEWRRLLEESDDGYVRQSVVRALRDGYPRIEHRLGATDLGSDNSVDRTHADADAIDPAELPERVWVTTIEVAETTESATERESKCTVQLCSATTPSFKRYLLIG